VARDEALAEAAARDKSRLDRDREAESRMELLRGNAERRELDDVETPQALEDGAMSKEARGESRKRKRLPGEDDTDRDLRQARERAEGVRDVAVARLRATKAEEADAPITDRRGNINLFPESVKGHGNRRRTEEDKEKARQKEAEENMGMPLNQALGRDGSARSWYMDADGTVKDREGRDVWGNEDPRRLKRDSQRVASADPLAFMKQAQTRLKEVQRERRVREQEMQALPRKRDANLEDFSLDGPAVEDPRESKHRSRQSSSRREKRRHERDRRDSRRSPG